MATVNLLATKFHRPSPPDKWVQRPRLCERLNEGLASNRQITLVSAPAGFGKTTCISEWVSTLARWTVAWLSLDPTDDDPVRFFTYFIAALQKMEIDLGREIEGVLRSGQLPPVEIISTTIINSTLKLDNRSLLVLDDFHVIQDPYILQVVERLLASLPSPLHLVLLTREDPPLPLAWLRANNRLTEIRAKDLRFTRDDAAHFLNEVMGLALSRADISVLEDKTEGWIVGLQLAGLSIRDQTNPSSFIAALSGGHRFILSYLTEQVLSQQPEEIQHFLFQTAILDELNGDLCNAVTGRSDSHALLERLLNANLFLIPLDDEQQWYRYHHLFADLLRGLQSELEKEPIAGLHQRASRWYAQANRVHEAIQHALAAADYAMAVALLEDHAMNLIMQGYAKTVNSWVQAIPPDWNSQSPRITLAFAWMHLFRGDYAQFLPYFERLQEPLEKHPAGNESLSLKAEWLVMQSLMLYKQGQMTESMAAVTHALEIVPEQDARVRSLAYWELANLYQAMDDYSHAVEAYQMAIQYSRAAENLVAEMMSTAGLAVMAFEHGQLHLAGEIVAPVNARIERSNTLPPISGVVYGLLGEVCYQWFQIEQGRNHAAHALQMSILGGYNTGVILCRVLLSRLAHIEGDLETAATEIQQAADLVPVDAAEHVRQEVAAQQVRVYLAQNRPASAQMTLQAHGFSCQERFDFPALPPDRSLTYSMGLLYNSSLHFLLYQARVKRDTTDLDTGIELAGQLIARARQRQCIPIALETLLLRAQLYAALGNNDASLTDYVSALELAGPEGFIGVFVEQGQPVAEALAHLAQQNRVETIQPDYVERILAAFHASQSPAAMPDKRFATLPAPVQPLTDREREVLSLMAVGLKYKEIAAHLFISMNTVRYHVKAIYGKLNVNNRTQAIESARKLRLV